MSMILQRYHGKRDFSKTPEPRGDERAGDGQSFVVQKHAAGRLHYDLRLELDGVLKSWAVPKGPSLDPDVKSLAVEVEDHPLEYGSFEGVIPQGEYGGGTVMVWDRGTWTCEDDPRKSYKHGKLTFRLHGQRLRGRWALFRISGGADDRKETNWLLKKIADTHARPGSKSALTREFTTSVLSGREMKQIAADANRVWSASAGDDAAGSKTSRKPARVSTAADRPPSTSIDFASLAGARKRPLPKTFRPQLATLQRQAPQGETWLHELKFDGYRMLALIDEHGSVRLLTRRGNDWSQHFEKIVDAIRELNLHSAILDGEIVLLKPDGTTDFQALQNAIHAGRRRDLVYYIFDLPFCNGYDLTRVELIERKDALARQLKATDGQGPLRYSDHIIGRGTDVASDACHHGAEGIVSKQINGHYEQQRSSSWVKVKCIKRQEFVIGGWTDPGGSRADFGALLLGYYRGNQLIYCGRVGTGFTRQSLQQIKQQLDPLASPTAPFHNPPPSRRGDTHWVKPQLIAEVEFGSWTEDGILRQSSFRGLRDDKEPKQVTREAPTKPSTSNGAAATSKRADNTIAGVRLSNPDRVLYKTQGLTKLDLARYYDAIADHLLPYVIDRPLTIVRCPRGHREKCFYQKHFNESIPQTVRGIDVGQEGESEIYVAIEDRAGLISLVQLGVLEIHCWGSRRKRLEQPDLMVFDLDPDESVPWESMIDAAHELRDRLEELSLTSFLRTTGGKGLHVVVPLEPRAGWDEVKSLSKHLADSMVRDQPARYVATASKAKRRGKVFIDYLRNGRGATAIANYSTRARAGAPVATPIRWDELTRKLSPDKYHVRNILQRLRLLSADPWDGFFTIRQRLPKSVAAKR